MAEVDRIRRTATAHRGARRGALIGVALLTFVALGCSDDDSGSSTTTVDESSTSSSTESTTTSSSTTVDRTTSTEPNEQSVEDEIITRYIGYWDARFEANTGTPNPDDPALREYATGEQLDAVIAEIQSNLDQGLALRRAEDPVDYQKVTVIEVEGDRAVVQECVVSDGVVIRRDTGEVVNDDVATHNVRGELLRVDGKWRVSSAELIQRWEGVAGCAGDA